MTKIRGVVKGIRMVSKKEMDRSVKYIEITVLMPMRSATDLTDLARHFQNESEFIIKSSQENLKV